MNGVVLVIAVVVVVDEAIRGFTPEEPGLPRSA
jgi:hypothetical protein